MAITACITIFAPATAFAANNTIRTSLTGVGSQHAADSSWTSQFPPKPPLPCNRWVVPPATPGSNTLGNGSQSTPWQSIKFAVNQARPGDYVCVAGGTYYENHFVPGASGTATKPIVFVSTGTILLRPDVSSPSDINKSVFDFTSAVNNLGKLEYWGIDRFPMDRSLNGQNYDGIGFDLEGLAGPIDHMVIQNTSFQNSEASSGMLIRGRVSDVLVRGNSFANDQRWQLNSAEPTDPALYYQQANYYRRDANGISIEGTNTGSGQPSVQRIYIDSNNFTDLGGDGIQCLGVNDAGAAQTGDPKDIDIVDNKFMNDENVSQNQPITENAVDIKSCQYVSVRGRMPASGEPTGSKMKEYKATADSRDATGNHDNGVAVSVHYNARNVLIENNRIWSSCSGIAIGQSDHQVQNVVIRRNLIFNLRYHDAAYGGSSSDANRCSGEGIHITNANHADVYNNTLDGIPRYALDIGQDTNDGVNPAPGSVGLPSDIAIWNNIFDLSNTVGVENRIWISLGLVNTGATTGVNSDYNLFWHANGSAAGNTHFAVLQNGILTAQSLSQWQTSRDMALGTGAWADPMFVADPTDNDYYTIAGSPARDHALNNYGASYCGAGLDIGFLESCK